MRALKIFLCLSLVAFGLKAQENTPPSALKISDGYFLAGVLMSNPNPSSVDDFRQIFPESRLLNQDFSQYENNVGYTFNQSSSFYAAMAIDFLDKATGQYRPNIQFRVGVGITPITGLGSYYSNESRFRFDTLNTSQPIYVDSIYSRSTGMSYSASNVNLDLSFLVRTSPENRWVLYSGIGVSGGITLDSYVEINHYSNSRLQSTDIENSYYESQSSASEREFKRMDPGFAGSVYLPLGVSYRLSEKNDFWRKVNLVVEGRPMVEWNQIPELGLYTNTTFMASFGVKISG